MSLYYRNNSWTIPSLKKVGFKKGSVLRVKMKNFLTFDECEVFPGPRLNVVLGPNGTGKSSVTHAICLACGGNPKTVGRSPDMTSFVKQGTAGKGSYVEIDLFRGETVVTVRRTINSETKSSVWHVNQAQSTFAAVKGIMTELAIDVDNLCSFMPQDRVGEFSRNTAKETLQKTLQSIVNPDNVEQTLAEEQTELADLEKSKAEQEKDLTAKKTAFDTMQQQINGMKAEVDRMEARRNAQDKLHLCQVKYKVQYVKDGQAEVTKLQNQVQAASAALQEAEKLIEPLQEKARDLQKSQDGHEQTFNGAKKTLEESQSRMNKAKDQLDQFELQTDEAHQQMEAVDKMRKRHEADLAKVESQIVDAEEKLAKLMEKIPEINTRLAKNDADMKEMQRQENDLMDDVVDMEQKRNEHEQMQRNLKRQIDGFREPAQVFRGKLQQMSQTGNSHVIKRAAHDTLSSMDWLDGEQQRGRYGSVKGPVGLYMKVSDPSVAAMVEMSLGSPVELMGFIAQDEAEGRDMRAEMKRRGLLVDVDTMTNETLDRPIVPVKYLEQFKNIGMKGYLGDQVECEPMIRAWLYQWKKLHMVMWARTDASSKPVDESHYNLLCPDEFNASMFRLYVCDASSSSRGSGGRGAEGFQIMEYVGRRSRYNKSAPPSTSSQLHTSSRSTLLDAGAGEDHANQKARLTEQLAEAKAAFDEVDQQIRAKRDEIRGVRDQMQPLKDDRVACNKVKKMPEELNTKIKMDKRHRDLCKSKLTKSSESERTSKRQDFERCMDAYLKGLELSVTMGQRVLTKQVEVAAAKHFVNLLEDELSDAKEAVSDAKKGLIAFKDVEKEAKAKRDQAQKTQSHAQKDLEDLVVELGGQKELQKVYIEARKAFPEDDLTFLREKLLELQEEIEASVDNPEVLRRYEELKQEAEKAQTELSRVESKLENYQETYRQRIEEWKRNVQQIAEKLNISFKEFMEALQYRGEVNMIETDMIANYEMQLKVCFRAESNMVELSGQRHSGGERAVSTVMYLMALQEMTSAPFRVVDEINQGMDERNERLVFDRIVQSCCTNSAAEAGIKPQYFLVSPKLLQGLRSMEHDDVTILLVWNGPGVKSKWMLHEVIKGLMLASGQKEAAAADDEDEFADFEPSGHKGKENRLLMQSPAGAGAASGSSSSSGTKGGRGGKRAVGGDVPDKGKKKQKV